MRTFSLFPLASLCLVACATTAGYEKQLSRWQGAAEAELIRAWGLPARVHEAAGHRFLSFEVRDDIQLPEIPPTYQTTVKGGKAYTVPVGGSPATTLSQSCTTTFELAGGRVVGWTYAGNHCKALE